MVGHALARQQDDLTPANNLLRRGPGPHQGFQLVSLPFVDGQSSSTSKHATIESRIACIVNTYMGRDTSDPIFTFSC